ncbi:MAG: response regulator, partial [Clostridia bacterium]|nr:response regulator [Clostridia bacterium]
AVEKFLASEVGDYDLILMDVMMPIMNGYEATETIRCSTHPLAATIPIIAQTANAFQDDIKRVKDVGMNAHISKPIDEENLLRVLAQYKN